MLIRFGVMTALNVNTEYEDGADSDWCGISSKKRLQK